MTQTKATSIHQIAKHVGVSATTVSRVINKDPQISPKTVGKVQAAIKELNYTPRPPSRRPGPQIVTRKKDKALNIALLTNMTHANFSSPIYAEVIKGIESKAESDGCTLTIINNSENNDFSKIDGIILLINQPDFHPPVDLPCVRAMGRLATDASYDHITYNDTYVGEQAADYLINKGCTEAVIIAPASNMRPRVTRASAFTRQFEAQGGTVQMFTEEIILDIGGMKQLNTMEYDKLAPQLQNTSTPVGIFSTSDYYLPYLISNILPSAELEADKTSHIISVNNIQEIHDIIPSPKPPSFELHAQSIGKRAVDQLLWRIKNSGEPKQELRLVPQLIQR